MLRAKRELELITIYNAIPCEVVILQHFVLSNNKNKRNESVYVGRRFK